jgi:hypothetical protein
MVDFDKRLVFSKYTSRIPYNMSTMNWFQYLRRVFRRDRIDCVNFGYGWYVYRPIKTEQIVLLRIYYIGDLFVNMLQHLKLFIKFKNIQYST